MRPIRPLLALFALLACATTKVCSAGIVPSIQVKFDNPIFNGSGYDNVYISYADPAASATMVTEYVSAGRFQGTGSNVQGISASIFVDGLNDLYMYCYDVYQGINHGADVRYTINLDGELDRTRQFLAAVNKVLNTGKATADPYAWVHPATASQGAAIQLGIWESKYETGNAWDLAGGSFRAWALDATTTTAWDQFVGAISSGDAIDKQFILTLESATYQDMITADPPARVPEPGSLGLLGTGLAMLTLVTRRKQRPGPAH